MKVLSLFTGIGGLDLGLERAGMQIVGQCEKDSTCRLVLRSHWCTVPIWEDVLDVTGESVEAKIGEVDLVCGGVPCQPVSSVGRRAGAKDPRWLWPEFLRVVDEVRPRWVIAENPVGLLSHPDSRGIICGLEASGYEVHDPFVLGSWHIGGSDKRDRVWILAHAQSGRIKAGTGEYEESGSGGKAERAAPRLDAQRFSEIQWPRRPGNPQEGWEEPRTLEPELGTTANGFSKWMVRYIRSAQCAVGNAVNPYVAEAIGRTILVCDGS